MAGFAFALLLMGCSDDGSACKTLATADHAYTSRAACLIDQDALLNGEVARKADYPDVMVQCVATKLSVGDKPAAQMVRVAFNR